MWYRYEVDDLAFADVVRASTQHGCTCGVFVRARKGTTASDSPELTGPKTTLTFCPRVSSAAPLTALLTSVDAAGIVDLFYRQLNSTIDADAGGGRWAGQRRQIADRDWVFRGDCGLGEAACDNNGARRFQRLTASERHLVSS